jgi:hypothetical protein
MGGLIPFRRPDTTSLEMTTKTVLPARLPLKGVGLKRPVDTL